MRLSDELAWAKFLVSAQQNAIINEFFSAGPFESHDEVIDGEVSLLLLVNINHYSTFMHHNQPITMAKSQFQPWMFPCRLR
jgi:hypothetical protein